MVNVDITRRNNLLFYCSCFILGLTILTSSLIVVLEMMGYPSVEIPLYVRVLTFPLMFITFPMVYYRGDASKIKEQVIPTKVDLLKGVYVFLSIVLTFLILIPLIVLGLGLPEDQEKVMDKISHIPLHLLLIIIVLGSVGEELTFRGILIKKIGYIPSTLLFGILHIGYGSIVEVLGATLIGAILGYYYIRWNRVQPLIIAHLVFNLLMLYLGVVR